MPSRCPRLLAIAGVAVLCYGRSLLAQSAPSLGSAASFAVLGGTSVTNSGATIVTGNLGVRPGGSITGFPPGVVKVGSIRNDLAQQAQVDASAAYNDLTNQPCSPVSSQKLGHGVYCLSSLTGTLTLDAAGDKNAVWIFRSATLTSDPGASVQVINDGYAGNVFWQVSDSAALAAGTVFAGNILARNAITLGHGASLSGRALSLSGAVTLDTNDVSLCCEPITVAPAGLPKGKTGTPFGPVTFTASGGLAPYTFSVTGSIPPGLDGALAGKPTKSGSYPVTVTAVDSLGCPGFRNYTIDVVCGTIVIDPPELPKTCEVSQVVTASGSQGPYTFTAGQPPDGIAFTQTTDTTALLSGRLTAPGCSTVTVTATDKFSCSSSRTYQVCTLAISCPPDGVVGTPYPQTPITATGGTAPYTCTLAGDLPPGLVGTGCTISGIPTKADCYPVTVTVTDANGFQCSKTCTICIAPPCAILPDTLPDGIVGTVYPQKTITATGVTSQYTCSVTGNVPPGLSFANCTISGMPTTKGCFPFTVTVTDDHGVQCSKTYTVCVTVFCAITLAPETLPAGIVGTPYPATPIAPSGGTAPYGYSVSGNLPPGLTFAGGTISGTPAARGCFPFTVTTTDANGCQASRTYTICVTCPDISISPTTVPNGNIGTPYNQLITASGGTGPYTFSLASGSLPPGLTLSPDGTLSGIPTTTGPYCFSIQAVDSAGCAGGSDDPLITISAASCPPGTIVTLNPPGLPEAQTNAPYAQLITASGGTAPYTFAVTAGTLPPGLTLSAAGLVSGTPTASGSYNLTITATDVNGCVGSTGCNITMLVDIPLLSGWGMGALSIMAAAVGVLALRSGGR